VVSCLPFWMWLSFIGIYVLVSCFVKLAVAVFWQCIILKVWHTILQPHWYSQQMMVTHRWMSSFGSRYPGWMSLDLQDLFEIVMRTATHTLLL